MSSFTDRERKVIRSAARQAVRFMGWHRAVSRYRKEARLEHGYRRAAEVYVATVPRPVEPKPAEGLDRKKRAAWRDADPGYLAWQEADEVWVLEYRRLSKDLRRELKPYGKLVLPDGLFERRKVLFMEQTAEEVIDELTGSDTKWWARLASAAIILTEEKGFRAKAGRPLTVSEVERDR